jgi:hypothetical protein
MQLFFLKNNFASLDYFIFLITITQKTQRKTEKRIKI